MSADARAWDRYAAPAPRASHLCAADSEGGQPGVLREAREAGQVPVKAPELWVRSARYLLGRAKFQARRQL